MPACYIGVAHAAQVAVAALGGFVAFSHGRKPSAERLAVGDRVIYYAPKDDCNGLPVQAFVAHATVTGTVTYQRDFPQGEQGVWVRDATFDPVRPLPVLPLIASLDFVTDKAHWAMAFRGGRVRISTEDYERIAERLMVPVS